MESGGGGNGEEVLSAKRAADVLRDVYAVTVSDQSLLNWAESMEDACRRKVGGVWKFVPAACAAWIKKNKPRFGMHGGARVGAGRKKTNPYAKPDPAEGLLREAERAKAERARQRAIAERDRLVTPEGLAQAMLPPGLADEEVGEGFGGQGGMDAAEANRRLLVAKAAIMETEYRKLRGELIEVGAVKQSVRHVTTVLRAKMQDGALRWTRIIGDELALSDEQRRVVQGVLRREVDDALMVLSEMGPQEGESVGSEDAA